MCDLLLCQTEAIAHRVKTAVRGLLAEERVVLLPPMIPDELAQPRTPSGPLRRLLYAGKFSPEYYFLEMARLFSELRAELPNLEWDIAGDKIHNPPADPGFRDAARGVLEAAPGVVWHGAVSRERVRELLGGADLALSLRRPDMDLSTELSTKVLEYGAAGCPVLLNRNDVHMALLGED
jgi:glycosyltransferase involved in cell wall biosynthesis